MNAKMFIGLIVLAVGIIVGYLTFDGSKLTERPCSDYANTMMQYVPARCIQYFQK